MGKPFPEFLSNDESCVIASLVFATLAHVLEEFRDPLDAQKRSVELIALIRLRP